MLKVRVTFNVQGKFVQKYYSTKHSLSRVQWEKMCSESVPFSLRKIRQEVLKFEAQANSIVSVNPLIKPELFEALYVGKYSKGSTISVLYQEVIDKMDHEGRVGTASNYRYSLNSLKAYRGDFPLEVVDVDFLKQYERWFVDRGGSMTTVGFYLRPLRAIFNIAIDVKHLISRDLYPFRGYTIPKGSNFKKSLKKDDKVKLQKIKPENAAERLALAFWMFSYYCNGMNFTDIAFLRPSDIHFDVLTFVRRKTMRTVREVKPIIVPLRKETLKILKLFGTHKPYCFGIINDEMTAQQMHSKIHDWIRVTNKHVNAVASRIGISGVINTYNARHTFATMLLKGRADLRAIQQSLGHRSISTTESYLADLDIEELKKNSRLL